ncbi:glycoside hydrolase family 3 protein [Egibacter rhizosphaerae]|uniref:beta-N-acetylhexosaminidase n=1 Tax=Egibacter rhizosphaerae TaxID=1670831 RepID=A0A411YEA6_9ACTN|nr:glycoside hydrolase family 3 protein [Egibacter rhizosphaerae]QBI19549.1 glycoside hydrolase family 3 protein [Egibacter rhizosphaerae]
MTGHRRGVAAGWVFAVAGLVLLGCEAEPPGDAPGRSSPDEREEATGDPAPDRPTLDDEPQHDPTNGTATGDADEEAEGTPDEPAGDAVAQAERVLERLSWEQKVGQLLVADVRGDHPTEVSAPAAAENAARFGAPTPAEVVARHDLGGVIYFTYAGVDDEPDPELGNIQGPEQVATLSDGLQEAATEATGVPLLVATDQEHGFITRTPEPFTRMPGPMALGAADDVALAEESARAAAVELRAVGINVTLAPTADVNTEPTNPVIGVRSVGAEPELVGRMVAAQVRGLDDGGVGATAKHFPGHGSVDVDSHEALPTVDDAEEALRAVALPPFREAIEAGVGAVMPGHLAVPAFDDEGRPATVSPAMIDGLLREDLGFDGVVVTDALDMEGITGRGEPAEVALEALEAGVDVLLMPPDLPDVRAGLIDAVETGALDEDRLDASVRRVLIWKAELGLLGDDRAARAPIPDGAVGVDEHTGLSEEVARAAVTAIEAACDVLPFAEGEAVAVVGPRDGGVEELAPLLDTDGASIAAVPTDQQPSADQIADAVSAAVDADLVVQVTTSAWRSTGQQQLGARLAESDTSVVAVASAEPYDATVTDADVHLATYDRGRAAMTAAAEVLRGGEAPGRLPVPVGAHAVGDGAALADCD